MYFILEELLDFKGCGFHLAKNALTPTKWQILRQRKFRSTLVNVVAQDITEATIHTCSVYKLFWKISYDP